MVEIKETHWETIQAKTFTKWYNDKLKKGGFPLIQDIYKDLHDGVSLGNLLKCIVSSDISYNKKPFTRIQKVENLEILLRFIKKQGLSLINIGPEDIVDCNKKLILGLVWTLISKLSISELGIGDLSMKEELLRWCREATKDYKNVNIIDLSRSWQDGLGFNALIHKFRPDLVPNYEELRKEDIYNNLEQAFDIAERKLQIPKLLDVEDVADVVRPDEKIMITYLSEYYKKFYQSEKDKISKNVLNSLLNKIEWSLQSRNFYEIKARSFLNKQKIYQEKKKELDEEILKISSLQNELQNINSTLSKDYLNLQSTLEEINLLHNFYNIKEYSPPSEISIDKINFKYEDLKLNLINKFKIETLENEEEKINEEIKQMKIILLHQENINKRFNIVNDKVNSNNNFINEDLKNDYKNLQEVLVQFAEFLNFLNNENLIKENTLNKAIRIFDNSGKEMSLKDFKNLVSKLGIYIDENFINKEVLNREEFIDTVKYLLIKSYDSVIIQKAFEALKDETELNEKDHKNLLCYNGKNTSISLTKLVNEFLK
ncbi:alpha-actinin-like protein 1 (AIN1) [Vairimorpha necatrix]|uniref:Alpha-actinin-like protein 1 (AIN1) n=1 Tax=Vairimorpha necatrix TaxID=6039 RepID=A0AAX4JAA3_9MICR